MTIKETHQKQTCNSRTQQIYKKRKQGRGTMTNSIETHKDKQGQQQDTNVKTNGLLNKNKNNTQRTNRKKTTN